MSYVHPEEAFARFQESFRRCTSTELYDREYFFQLFYEYFMARGDHIQSRFDGVDFQTQVKMLKESFETVIGLGNPEADARLSELAQQHSAMGIPHDDYDDWVAALLPSAENCDDTWDASADAAWRAVIAPAIAHMRAAINPDS